jgi:hypothetical protein
MTFDEEMATLIQRYLKEVKSEDLSIEEILTRPRWKRVWIYWHALEKYEGKPMSTLTMDECKSIYGD